MALLVRNLLFFLVISLLFPSASVWARDAHGRIPLLATRHKFSTAQGDNISVEERNRFEIENLAARGSKIRPQEGGAAFPDSPEVLAQLLSARSAVVLDAGSGRLLYAQQPDLPAQPASTIKILTGLIAIESLNDNDLVPVSRYAANMPRSKVYLQRGKRYRAGDLINAVLLASANDASVALAEQLAGSEKAFARLMTEKARVMGARNTLCRSASGLTRKGQHSTARDLAVIFRAAMKHPEFAERISRKKVRTRFGKVLRTHNRALWMVDGAVGGKTGYTRAARQTYVGLFERDGRELIVAIMGSETMWDDISRLVEYGFAAPMEAPALHLADGGGEVPVRVPVVSRIRGTAAPGAVPLLSGSKKASQI